jgi:uncharacterized protein (DUF305 family)
MADLDIKKAQNAKAKQIGAAIQAAQSPEIQQLSDWLTGWGKPVPSRVMTHAMPGGGMMTEQDMDQLKQASGAAFDRTWVEMMIKHNQGAVAMAKTEQPSGERGKAIQLAKKKIGTARIAETATMQELLRQLQ